VAIIPLARSLPNGSSDLPEGFGRAALLKSQISNLRSQRLPIWSCTARSLPGRACHQTRRCALTSEIPDLKSQ